MEAKERLESTQKELNEAVLTCQQFIGKPLGSIPSYFKGHDLEEMRKAFDRFEKANDAFFDAGKDLHSKK